MPFFQPAFYAPAQVDGNAFTNLFQLINDIDGYQRESACESACKPKQQQQQQQQKPAQPKPQQKPQAPQKPQATKQPQKKQAVFHHPFEEFLHSIQESAAAAQRAASLPTFHPRFDVRETQDSYELHGELAGVDRSNVSLEFTEPQTLVVSGKVERNYHSKNSTQAAVPAVENTPEAIADTHSEASHDDDDNASASGARTPIDEEFTEIDSPRSASPARSHRATVTDEEDEEALERGRAIAEEKKTVVATTPAPVAPAPTQTTAAPSERYWYQERAIGQFKREFNFPVPVDESNVRASLENGILSVSVPKVKREVRRIVVF
ncbi:heat shock protein 30 [Ophiostoma piceae UAMH 11346]|uniref:Heat shock protein 30 n=1 Tax=Ophiostoma piceae (strain UAMH 11346) TaxID=1262450 RepID=S3CRI6_OPHP1|nr:heat shock protein 30 [Ophiostoma piceae UAMH 11346]